MTQADEPRTRQQAASVPARRRRILRYLFAYLVLASATLVAGLQHFVLTLPQATTGAIQHTDGIVVVTGGQQRLDDGLQLLTAGKAERMLISGVGEGVNRAVLVQELNLDDREAGALFCVELDFTADNTAATPPRNNGPASTACGRSVGHGKLSHAPRPGDLRP